MIEVVKIKLIRNQLSYFPRPTNDIYFGVVFSREERDHITIKSFRADIEGRIVFGFIDRFLYDDIEIDYLSPKTFNFE